MKIYSIITTYLLILVTTSHAQVVTEDVFFDFYQSATNNDLANFFTNTASLTPLSTNGITGGCLLVPDSVDWANDKAVYCSHYHPFSGDTMMTAICFKYDSSTVQLSSYQRALSIFLSPSADPNHYLIASVSGNKKLELISYGWVNSPYPSLNLVHQHWYQCQLTTAFFYSNTQVTVKAAVYDLGFSGTANPVLVNADSGFFFDAILALDTSIEVAVSATAFGGSHYLDNFHFYGRKGNSNCSPSTFIQSPEVSFPLHCSYSVKENTLSMSGNSAGYEYHVVLQNSLGKIVKEVNMSTPQTRWSTAMLSPGVYFLSYRSKYKFSCFKFVVCP